MKYSLLGLASVLAVAEVALHLFGVGDLPTYDIAPDVGYMLKPNQSGAFLNRRHYVFNDHRMGVSAPYKPNPDDVILMGDSLVYGGVQFDQPDRLGPRLEMAAGRRVWPLGAASWGFVNELVMSERDPSLLNVGTTVFLLNSEDFSARSQWRSDLYNPRTPPNFLLAYVVGKQMVNALPPDTAIRANIWRPELTRFLSQYEGRTVVALYRTKTEQLANRDPFILLRPEFKSLGVEVCDVGSAVAPSDYRDDMHPRAAGNITLAKALADCI